MLDQEEEKMRERLGLNEVDTDLEGGGFWLLPPMALQLSFSVR